MKRTLLIALLTLFSAMCVGQDGGPLKFLGIPIDGTETQFAAKLKAKGFIYNSVTEGYKGQFNGKNVDVYIHTNHNMVDRVYVAFPYTSEESIRVEFNRLLSQFNDNGKYMDLSMNEEIPSNEDISYEVTVNKKRYQASFSYFDSDRDPIALITALMDKLTDFFTDEQLAELKDYVTKAMDLPEDQRDALQAEMMAEMMTEMQKIGLGQDGNTDIDPEKTIRFFVTYLDSMRSLADGEVWFMIHERYGRYQIGLYYDNLHNQAHGEDL